MSRKRPAKTSPNRSTERAVAESGPAPCARLLEWLERRALVLSVALVLLATIRIVATYPVLSHTSDEPAHIASGLEWIDKGIYAWDRSHPPLARVVEAAGLYLLGARSTNLPKTAPWAMLRDGLAALYRGHAYRRNLIVARAAVLPFFWLACAVVYVWGARYWGRAVAALAVFLFTMVPPVLGHAGLATNDMALTACLGAAFLAGLIWLEQPTWKHAVCFGGWVGLMVLAKFSCLLFFPACAGLALGCWFAAGRPRAAEVLRDAARRAPTFGLAVLLACVVIWAGYRFSFGPVNPGGVSLPAPDLWIGIGDLLHHAAGGHRAFLMGRISETGFPYYFEVALALKTPLAFLGLSAVGIALACGKARRFTRAWLPLAFAAGLLAAAALSRITIGLRHVLPVYIALSLVGAMAVVGGLELADRRLWIRLAIVLPLGWLCVASATAHPDYFPYFNELAGGRPERFLVDSDLDWGQDIDRASRRLKELGAREVSFEPLFIAWLEREHGFPKLRRMNPAIPDPGWSLVSLTYWKQAQFGLALIDPKVTTWVDFVPPTERVGKGMLLYYFPER